MMQQLLYISVLFLFASCSVSKKTTHAEKRDSIAVETVQRATNRTITERSFGDTLRALIPVPALNVPVAIESSGIAAEVMIVNETDTAGRITGQRMKITATAKPVNEKLTNEKIAEVAHGEKKTAVQITETATVTRKPIRVLYIAGVIGLLILCFFIYKNIKRFF